MAYIFSKENDSDKIYQVDDTESVGGILFSFDGKKVYNAFIDYPYNLTEEEKRIFDKEMPYWRDFFSYRCE